MAYDMSGINMALVGDKRGLKETLAATLETKGFVGLLWWPARNVQVA